MLKLFKSRNEKDVEKLRKTALQIDALSEEYSKLSDEQLRAKTAEFKERYVSGESLDDLLVEAFATVREASTRVLNMRHFIVQLMGGIALHQGRIAEMKTGEGKTLVATLAAYLNALTGKGMHIVTVNDYLAKRDSEWMGKIYKFLGLTVGVVTHNMNPEERKVAYNSDILYATNNELGFDYLRDNMAAYKEDRVQRSLEFAIIDEVDNILIDEARTPLIISGGSGKVSDMYVKAHKFAKTLKDDDWIKEDKENTVRLSDVGIEKAEKYFAIDNLGDLENQEIAHYINNALRANVIMKKDVDYIVQNDQVVIVDEHTGRLMEGRRYSDGLHQAIEAKEGVRIQDENQTLATVTFQNFFRLYKKLSGMTGTAKTEEAEFQDIYNIDVVELPTNLPIQRKDYQDQLYTTKEGKYNAILKKVEEAHKNKQPVLVGTISVEVSEKLAEMLSKKRIECNVLNAKNHQREAEIVAQAGKLGAVTIATNMAGRGTDIMLGGNPEFLTLDKLKRLGYKDEVLAQVTSFAQIDDEEILKAKEEYNKYYKLFKVETDKEKEEVLKVGGLLIIGTERHDSRRIDNQLRGRAGRQGDPGESVFYLSMEDDVLKIFGGEMMQRIASRFNFATDDVIENKILTRQIENAQARVEDRNFSSRKYVLSYDNIMNAQRKIIYEQRNRIIDGETDLYQEIVDMIDTPLEDIIETYADTRINTSLWDYGAFNSAIEEYFVPKGSNIVTEEICKSADIHVIKDALKEIILQYYDDKKKVCIEDGVNFDEIERYVMLKVIDSQWIEHLDNMDRLKEAAGLRAYGQKDPVVVFKNEGVSIFNEMADNIRKNVVKILFKADISRQVSRTETAEAKSSGFEGDVKKEKKKVTTVIRKEAKVGRNDACPCGSGLKYKNCCGK